VADDIFADARAEGVDECRGVNGELQLLSPGVAALRAGPVARSIPVAIRVAEVNQVNQVN
jgi:hypothetical protein